jgi:hypothetical protein
MQERKHRDSRLPRPFDGCWDDKEWYALYKRTWNKIKRESQSYRVDERQRQRDARKFRNMVFWAVKKVLRENQFPERIIRRPRNDVDMLYGVRKVYQKRRDGDNRG